jgi:hypothetical protein
MRQARPYDESEADDGQVFASDPISSGRADVPSF